MNYATITFLCFLLAVGVIYFATPKKFQWLTLLSASLLFYMLSCGIMAAFLPAAATVVYAAGILLSRADAKLAVQLGKTGKASASPVPADASTITDQAGCTDKGSKISDRKAMKKQTERKKKQIVAISVILLIAMILSTKYCNLFGSAANAAAGILGFGKVLPTFHIIMPLGISYYTLMGISYITDVYRKTIPAERNPLRLLLFLCYFPHITEGPFERYGQLSPQFKEPHSISYDRIKDGGIRLLWGIFKKLVIADRAGLIVNTIFSHHGDYSGGALAAAAILYTLQIYAEFSGCMDMVCGASQMLGITMPENFRQPFFSRSVGEFWRRWHITLGQWLKDYVFYPVSLSRHFRTVNEKVRRRISSRHLLTLVPSAYALFFVWFCNGLWHGAGIKFIVYGLYYYALMMLGQAFKPLSDRCLSSLGISRGSRPYHFFEIMRTCVIVCFGMIIFRADDLTQAASISSRIFLAPGLTRTASELFAIKGIDGWDYLILVLSFFLLLAVSLAKERGICLRSSLSRKVLPVRWTAYMLLIFSIIILGAYGGDFVNTTFIYGEF